MKWTTINTQTFLNGILNAVEKLVGRKKKKKCNCRWVTDDRETRRKNIEKQVIGMLKNQIDCHGTITKFWVGSTAKRIAHQLEAVIYNNEIKE